MLTLTVSVDVPALVVVTATGLGLKLPLLNRGTPLTLRLTLPVKPFTDLSVIA